MPRPGWRTGSPDRLNALLANQSWDPLQMFGGRPHSSSSRSLEVPTAVSAAEITLETVVAVRDEVVKAYQEILRMPI